MRSAGYDDPGTAASDTSGSLPSTLRNAKPSLLRLEASHQAADVGVGGWRVLLQQRGAHGGGVGDGLGEDDVGALVDQEVAGDAVGDDGQRQAGDERGQAEEQRDAGAQT